YCAADPRLSNKLNHSDPGLQPFGPAGDGNPFGGQTFCGDNDVALTSYLGANGTDVLHRDGIFVPNRQVRIDDITDGTSNTIAAGERPPAANGQMGMWMSMGLDYQYDYTFTNNPSAATDSYGDDTTASGNYVLGAN